MEAERRVGGSLVGKENNLSCIMAVADGGNFRMYDWYAFDVSDDPNHNQPRPSGLDFTLQPPLSRYYRKLPAHLLPFHEDDDYASVNLTPIATRDLDAGKGWAVLGNKHPTTLYRSGKSMERIDLAGGANWFSTGEWSPVSVAHSCLVLRDKLYCLGGLNTSTLTEHHPEGRPWAMAYNPGVEQWEPLPDPPCRPKYHPMFTAAIDCGQWGPSIVVPSDHFLQLYHVDTRCWELLQFDDPDRILTHPLSAFSPSQECGRAVAVDNKLFLYMKREQRLVGYDLRTEKWFLGHLPMHNHGDYLRGPPEEVWNRHSPPSLGHLGHDGLDHKFCLSWVSHLLDKPEKEEYISRLHCLKVRVVVTDETIPSTQIFHLEVSIISCQSYLVDGMKAFRGAMLVDGNLG